MPETAEHRRLSESPEDSDPWRLWGPYLAGRQWGTVREDYSADGDAWDFFPFDHAHRRAYRWGEDGIAGLSDRFGFLNLGVAMWNGRDDRLKERYFGLTNSQGNHGEDVKEHWWHLDATPTHSWAKRPCTATRRPPIPMRSWYASTARAPGVSRSTSSPTRASSRRTGSSTSRRCTRRPRRTISA